MIIARLFSDGVHPGPGPKMPKSWVTTPGADPIDPFFVVFGDWTDGKINPNDGVSLMICCWDRFFHQQLSNFFSREMPYCHLGKQVMTPIRLLNYAVVGWSVVPCHKGRSWPWQIPEHFNGGFMDKLFNCWLVVWNHGILWLSKKNWEDHHPNWRSHIFQRGRYTTNQINWSIEYFPLQCLITRG